MIKGRGPSSFLKKRERECPLASPRDMSRLHIIDLLQRAHFPEASDFPTQYSKEVLASFSEAITVSRLQLVK